jgi:hypothetical protein
MADEQQEKKEDLFAVYAVRKDEPTPLIQTHLPFGRLMEDIVMPFESIDMFFIDGAPVKATDLDRIKIIRQKEFFTRNFNDIHRGMHYGGDLKKQELYAKQYHIRLEALLRESGEDLTAQAVKAYRTVIKPKLKDYIPNKEALLGAAVKVFAESIKLLSGV